MESPQDQDRAVASSSSTGAMITDRQRCESPRQSISDAGHSDHSTLAEKEELDDVVPNELARISPHQLSSIRTNRRRRQDSWRSNQLSPTGTFFDLTTHKPLRPEDNFPIPFTESPSDDKSFVQMHLTAEPGHVTFPPSRKFYPCFPTQRNRYDRGVAVERNDKSWDFGPLETFTVHDVYCDRRWIPNTHPEGQLYFSSERKNGQHLYLTEEHLYEQKNVNEMERFIQEFEKHLSDYGDKLSSEIEIFAAFDEYGDEGWYYYCVDTARRCLFWVDNVNLTWMADTVGSVPTKAHLKYGLDYEYWIHVEHFPFHQTIPDCLIHDLLGVAIHQSVDSITSLDSTVPFSKEETQQLVSLVKHLHTLKKSGHSHGYIVVAAARLMTIFVNERFFHFAGQHGARLTRDQSIRGKKKSKRTYLIRLLSPILFYAPETHLDALEKIYVDEIIKSNPWKTFVARLEDDWIQYVLYSTVLLTADVSFLAVPNVMPNNGIPQGQAAPPAVVATQISLIAAMGSIVIGLLLVREHRKKSTDSAQAAAEFLRRRSHANRGLEAMAILYSLPFALLMWGMGSFLVALGVICFVFAVNGLIPTILYAVVWGFVSLMIVFTILTQLEARLSMSWRNFTLIKWLKLFKRLAWWRKKSKEDEEEEEMEMDRRSITTNADSVRSMRTRIRLDFFMRRKKDSRRDTVLDLGR